jgi:hypothetical protein
MRGGVASVVVMVGLAGASGCGFKHGALPPAGDAGDEPGADAVPIDAAPDAQPANLRVRVEAHIDGRDELILKDRTAQWHHYQFAAPGREAFVTLPTKFDSIEWFPVWPDTPNTENRDCDCVSSIYTELPTDVPRVVGVVASLTVNSARVAPSIKQQPSADNDYTLVVELTDVGQGGAAWNDVVIDVVVP